MRRSTTAFALFGLLSLSCSPTSSPSPRATTDDRPAALTLPELPEALKPPQGARLLFSAQAEGVQIYACKEGTNQAGKFAWVLKAPDAVLLDETGQKVGKHFAGPTWQWEDRSKVVGQLKAKAPAPKADAVDWLLLEATKHDGEGKLAEVAWIARVETEKGKAPAQGCDATAAGKELRVNYKARYLFYSAAP